MGEQFSVQALVFILILIVYVLTAHLIQIQGIPFLHESGVAIVMGLLSSVLVIYGLGGRIEFDNQIFFTIILPPIIFSAGYSLRKSLFFQNFGMITFLGVIGTVIGFVMITLFCWGLNALFFHKLPLKEIMLLSSVLCATDTVAAMSLIKPQKFAVLNAVLFGEGVINDAVAIVLFRTVEPLDMSQGMTFDIVLWMLFDFLVLLVLSLGVGAVAGFGLTYLFKVNEHFNQHPIKQTSLILLTGYVTYLIGELLGLSGIIALFTCAIIMGHFTFMNISQQSRRGTGLAFETVSFIAEAFVYAYMGASLLSLKGSWLAVVFALLILAFLPIVRAIMVYFLPAIYYCIKRPFPLKSNELKVCWYSGMVRGVIAFALCLQIESEHINFIVMVVLVIVLFTTITGASFLKTFCSWIQLQPATQISSNLDTGSLAKAPLIEDVEYKPVSFGLDGTFSKEQPVNSEEQVPSRSMREKLEVFQSQYMRPLFQKQAREQFNYDIEMPPVQDKGPSDAPL